jgi:hypothetical protein
LRLNNIEVSKVGIIDDEEEERGLALRTVHRFWEKGTMTSSDFDISMTSMLSCLMNSEELDDFEKPNKLLVTQMFIDDM